VLNFGWAAIAAVLFRRLRPLLRVFNPKTHLVVLSVSATQGRLFLDTAATMIVFNMMPASFKKLQAALRWPGRASNTRSVLTGSTLLDGIRSTRGSFGAAQHSAGIVSMSYVLKTVAVWQMLRASCWLGTGGKPPWRPTTLRD